MHYANLWNTVISICGDGKSQEGFREKMAFGPRQ